MSSFVKVSFNSLLKLNKTKNLILTIKEKIKNNKNSFITKIIKFVLNFTIKLKLKNSRTGLVVVFNNTSICLESTFVKVLIELGYENQKN